MSRGFFDWASGRIRGEFKESTWLAFVMTAFDGASPQTAAESLGISVGAVYAAKYRVMARLRETISQARVDSSDI